METSARRVHNTCLSCGEEYVEKSSSETTPGTSSGGSNRNNNGGLCRTCLGDLDAVAEDASRCRAAAWCQACGAALEGADADAAVASSSASPSLFCGVCSSAMSEIASGGAAGDSSNNKNCPSRNNYASPVAGGAREPSSESHEAASTPKRRLDFSEAGDGGADVDGGGGGGDGDDDDGEDMIVAVRIRSPGRETRRRIERARRSGEAVDLLSGRGEIIDLVSPDARPRRPFAASRPPPAQLSHDSESDGACEVAGVKSVYETIEERRQTAERDGQIECLLSQSPGEAHPPKAAARQQPSKDCSTPVKSEPSTAPPAGVRNGRRCVDCREPVEQSWQQRCNACFTVHRSSMPSSPNRASGSPGNSVGGACQVCGAATDRSWKKYCLQCYIDSKNSSSSNKGATSNNRSPNSNRGNSASSPARQRRGRCVDCGGETSEAWMSRCGPCFASSSSSPSVRAKRAAARNATASPPARRR